MKYQSKYTNIVRQIEDKIVSGEFLPGERIPSERELLTMVDASYMTLRRALNELSERGIVIRKGQKGSFLSNDVLMLIENKKVNFVYSTWEGPFFAELLQSAMSEGEKCGYEVSVIHFREHYAVKIKELLEKGEAVVLYGISNKKYPDSFKIIHRAACDSGSPLVIIGSDESITGTYCIRADDVAAIGLAVDHLKEYGHRRIMLAATSDYLKMPEYRRVEKWFDHARADKYLDRKMEYFVSLSHEHNNLTNFRDVLLSALKNRSRDATAIICMDHAILIAALSAAWHLNIKIPEELSLVVIGDTILSDFSQPPITGVTVNLAKHTELAMQAIVEHERDLKPSTKLQLVKPELIVRSSVKDLRH